MSPASGNEPRAQTAGSTKGRTKPWQSGLRKAPPLTKAELVDLYRTLSELAGIPIPTDNSRAVQGTSVVPAMRGDARLNNYSFSQFAKRGKNAATAFDVCMGCTPAGSGAAAARVASVSSRCIRIQHRISAQMISVPPCPT